MRKILFLLFQYMLPALLLAGNSLKQWTVASESPDYQLRVLPAASHSSHSSDVLSDTVEIVSPKGLTLWYNQKLHTDVVIEYDACLMLEAGHPEDRLSDLNCFWMASQPVAPRKKGESTYGDPRQISGRFLDSYRMQLYYVGYGGNSNKTTRFRRYTGDSRGVDSAQYRPAILTEYDDAAHLNVAGKWRHIRLTAASTGRVTYEIDGELLVDYLDPYPLTEGWFGLRTTWSRLRFTNFRVTYQPTFAPFPVELHDVSHVTAEGQRMLRRVVTPYDVRPVNFGVPFAEGVVHKEDGFTLDDAPIDFRPLAFWPDGSVKWGGFAGSAPPRSTYSLQRVKPAKSKPSARPELSASQVWQQMLRQLGVSNLYCQLQALGGSPEIIEFDSISFEQQSPMQTVLLASSPMVQLRAYLTERTQEVRFVHTFINSRPDDAPMLQSLEFVAELPLHEQLYNRHFATYMPTEQRVWHEAVQPLTGRRQLPDSLYVRQMRGESIPDASNLDRRSQSLIRDWASWDSYRVSQQNDMGYTIRKRAKLSTPWIGTLSGHRSSGTIFAGETSHGLVATLQDFWQSYPSAIVVEGMTADTARIRIQLWSSDGEPMDLRHYDTEAHGLEAAYEDVQSGMSSPFGIARTSELSLLPTQGWPGDLCFSVIAADHQARRQLVCSPQYLQQQRAFGVWSLPQNSKSARQQQIEQELRQWADFYVQEVQDRHWYGFWNYGDVMHAYDPVRQEWLYDVGGFAWDNTELASNMMLWYQFLRTGRNDLWQLAVAMTRHTSEVDVYHAGPWAGLGSRHNVTHWGCGAKESRISQAQWNRFYYYLSGGDERLGQLMRDVVDSDTLLYKLDPMRLAQPRSQFPCTAPARLRIGPDWLGYVSNWMTEWERTGNLNYLHKILAGMRSINALPNGIFSGPKALGYDPATGEISWEGDSTVVNTNHLLPIMGGFEMMNELLALHVDRMPQLSAAERDAFAQFRQTWLHLCREYQTRSENGFRIPRLQAYASWFDYNPLLRQQAWENLFRGAQTPSRFSTNGISCWCLDAIYMLEVAK